MENANLEKLEYRLSPAQWLTIPHVKRIKIAEVFGIPRSAGTIVEGGVVRSDGHTFDDLSHLSVENMQNFLGTKETDYMNLLNSVI